MSMYPQSQRVELGYATDERAVSRFFSTVYAWMCVGLAVTATVALLVSKSPTALAILHQPFVSIAVFLGLVGLAWGVGSAAHRISANVATMLFLLYAAVVGAMISWIVIVYPMRTIFAALGITAGTFAGMSVYGYVTKRDLSRMGSILIMCFWGLLVASIVNIFVANSVLDWIITYGILLVFVGLTAYDTQKLREIAENIHGGPELMARYAIVGSLNLYIDFINIFLSILKILGSRD